MDDSCKFRIGTSGWSYDDWQSKFYPENCSKRKWLEYYANKFNTVEINATFYRRFKDIVYQNWHDRVPNNFRYVLKIPRFITHRKFLLDTEDDVKTFWESTQILNKKLGLLLMQLSPHTPYDLQRLEKALTHFPDPKKLAVEFRHSKWFTDDTFKLLKKYRTVFCTADSPSTSLENIVTSDLGYIRLHGRTKWFDYNYSHQQLKGIAELAKNMQKKGAKQVYIFFNNDVNAYSVKNALTLKKMLE